MTGILLLKLAVLCALVVQLGVVLFFRGRKRAVT
jgi:hypothetical protein